jgi:signal transduction histidine kinase
VLPVSPLGPPANLPTVRQRLVSLLGMGFSMLLVATAAVFLIAHHRLVAELERGSKARAVALARELDRELGSAFRDLRSIGAALPGFDPRSAAVLHARRFAIPFAEALYLQTLSGELLAADPPTAGPLPIAVEGAVEAVSPLYRRAGDQRPTLALLQPVRRGGETALLVAEIDPVAGGLGAELRATEQAEDLRVGVLGADATLVLASREALLWRRLVGPPPPPRSLAAVHTGSCTLCPGEEATVSLVASAPLTLAPWRALVEQPRSRALAPLAPARWGLLALGLVTLATGLLLARALSRSLGEPLARLVAQADRLHEDLATPIAVRGDREVVALAMTLDRTRERLAASLGELETLAASLERQVVDRTAQISRQLGERRTLVERLLAAGEEERRRIARELHDELSQLLTVIQLSLERLRDDPGAAQRASDSLTRAQAELHRIIYDLRPSLLDDLGLAAAVGWYARNVLAARGVDVSVEVEEGLDLPSEVEITAFRIYQEIVTNVVRHAEAEHVMVALYLREAAAPPDSPVAAGRTLVLEVEDDGKGFDPAALRFDPRRGSAGLIGMRERAELVGAELTIDSEPGAGTHVQLSIPLPVEAGPAETVAVDGAEPPAGEAPGEADPAAVPPPTRALPAAAPAGQDDAVAGARG